MKGNENTSLNKRFVRKSVLNMVCAVITILLMIMQKNIMWMIFTVIFVILSITNLIFAQRHRNDEVDLRGVILGKIINRESDSRRDQHGEKRVGCAELTDDMEEYEKVPYSKYEKFN